MLSMKEPTFRSESIKKNLHVLDPLSPGCILQQKQRLVGLIDKSVLVYITLSAVISAIVVIVGKRRKRTKKEIRSAVIVTWVLIFLFGVVIAFAVIGLNSPMFIK